MDPKNLPIPFLTSLSFKLNSLDLLNLFSAIYNTSDTDKITNSYFYKLLFQPKICDLNECARIDYDHFKKILRFFKKKDYCIEVLKINFCINIFRHTSLKRMINDSLSRLKHLTELDTLNILSSNTTLDLNDLTKLFETCQKLTSLSFNLASDLDTNGARIFPEKFNNLISLKIEFKSTSHRTVLILISQYSLNLNNLELYSSYDESYFVLNLNESLFPFQKLAKLKRLVTGTNNLRFNLNNFLFDLVAKLDSFNLNVSINKANSELSRLINLKKIEIFELNFGIDLNFLRSNDILLNTNPYELDDLVKDYFMLNFNNKLESIKLYILIWPCILSNINLNLEHAKYLKRVDFSSIHIHSDKSICQLLANLTQLSELYLPCCALSNEYFKKSTEKTSFKRIFEETDEDNENSNSESGKTSTKELSYFHQNKIIKFLLCTPDSVNFKDKYFFNCQNVDCAELIEISKWTHIRSLTFQEFKVMGGTTKFDQFLDELTKKTCLNELNLINFNTFLTYNFQSVFSKHLKNFTHLKQFDLNFLNYFFTQQFCQSLLDLAPNLTVLKLKIDNFDCQVFKKNLDEFKRFKKLVLFELICKNKESEINFIKKSFKNVLPSWTIYQIYQGSSLGLANQQYQPKPNIFIKVSTKSTTCLSDNNFKLNARHFD
ncbi:unnamed protein product [Brachionus calyciflorus]|uniref:Uncharacterized protein n=1 Tax=Brachionus calyciflorus TaxID=104777 RepID=A0A814B8N5_9BILA|nr:unnamed protein product [Brachionus calyciflorus]